MFNPADMLVATQVKHEPSTPSIKSEERTTPPTPTSAPPPSLAPDAMRGILPHPLFAQVPFPPATMAQIFAAQAHAAAAAQAHQHGLAFPGVPVFPPGIPAELAGGGPMQFMIGDPNLFHPYSIDGMKKRNATREATAPLKEWLHSHRKNPYPSKGDKVLLAVQTRMTLTQVSTWFANARRRLKKENKMTWSPQNRRGDGCDEDDDEDDDEMNRPSSSNSINSERKGESLLGKRHLASPTPSGDSRGSDELVTPKKLLESPIPTDDSESPKRKKMWSVADVTSVDDSVKKDSSPPSSDENLNGSNMLLQTAMKKQIELMARMDPNIFRSAMNPFMFQLLSQQVAQAQLPFLSAQTTPPNEAGLNSQAETSTPSPESSPISSPRSHQG